MNIFQVSSISEALASLARPVVIFGCSSPADALVRPPAIGEALLEDVFVV